MVGPSAAGGARAWLAAGSRPAPLTAACPAGPSSPPSSRARAEWPVALRSPEPHGGADQACACPWGSLGQGGHAELESSENEEGGRVQTPASEPLWPVGPRLSVSVCLSLSLCVSASLSVSVSLCLSVPLSPCQPSWRPPSLCLSLSVSLSLCLCLPVSVSVCPCVCLSLCLCLSLYLCLSVCLPVSLCPSLSPSPLGVHSLPGSVCLSLCLSVPESLCLCPCVSVCVSLSVSLCLSVCPCISVSLSVSVCLSVSLSLSLRVSLCLCLSVSPQALSAFPHPRGSQGELTRSDPPSARSLQGPTHCPHGNQTDGRKPALAPLSPALLPRTVLLGGGGWVHRPTPQGLPG